MDIFFGIIIVIAFLFIVMRPVLARWFGPAIQRWAAGKFEDNMRRMAGMPTRKEERKAHKRARRRESEGASRFRSAASGSRAHARPGSRQEDAVDYLRSFAEDVEFVEIKEFSSDSLNGVEPHVAAGGKEVVENQIEDADFEEIKSPLNQK